MTAAPAGAAIGVERRAALNGAKLSALVTARWGPGDRRRGTIGTSATLVEDPRGNATGAAATAADDANRGQVSAPSPDDRPQLGVRTGWVLPDGDASAALGPALVWAERQQVGELHLVAGSGPDGAGVLARQSALFTDGPDVWAVEGTELRPAETAPVPARADAPAPPEIVDLLIDAGLEIVVEDGMVRGEVNGLEAARIVHGQTTAGEPIDAPQLEVGVGKADRELTAMVHAGLPPVEQLARVVEIVREHRRPGAPRHPLNQLVPDRWLRAVLCRAPDLAGLANLRPAEGARPRSNLTERGVALAVGEDPSGTPMVVACSVGIAPDLVPTAADGRAVIDAARADADAQGAPLAGVEPGGATATTADAGAAPSRLLLAVPERDDHPGTRRLAARLRAPAEVVPIPGDWRAAGV